MRNSKHMMNGTRNEARKRLYPKIEQTLRIRNATKVRKRYKEHGKKMYLWMVPPSADDFEKILAPIRIRENRKLCNLGRFMHNQFSNHSIHFRTRLCCTALFHPYLGAGIYLLVLFFLIYFFLLRIINRPGLASRLFAHLEKICFFP